MPNHQLLPDSVFIPNFIQPYNFKQRLFSIDYFHGMVS